MLISLHVLRMILTSLWCICKWEIVYVHAFTLTRHEPHYILHVPVPKVKTTWRAMFYNVYISFICFMSKLLQHHCHLVNYILSVYWQQKTSLMIYRIRLVTLSLENPVVCVNLCGLYLRRAGSHCLVLELCAMWRNMAKACTLCYICDPAVVIINGVA